MLSKEFCEVLELQGNIWVFQLDVKYQGMKDELGKEDKSGLRLWVGEWKQSGDK